jgi:hypothetical protein
MVGLVCRIRALAAMLSGIDRRAGGSGGLAVGEEGAERPLL